MNLVLNTMSDSLGSKGVIPPGVQSKSYKKAWVELYIKIKFSGSRTLYHKSDLKGEFPYNLITECSTNSNHPLTIVCIKKTD